MDDSASVELHKWADGPYSLIKTPKYQEGKVEFISVRVAEYHNKQTNYSVD